MNYRPGLIGAFGGPGVAAVAAWVHAPIALAFGLVGAFCGALSLWGSLIHAEKRGSQP